MELTLRDEMANNAFKSLLLANCGGAVTLLTFLQTTWSQPAAQEWALVVEFAPMLVGVFCAAAVLHLRYIAAYQRQIRNPIWWRWRTSYLVAALESLVWFAFLTGTETFGVLLPGKLIRLQASCLVGNYGDQIDLLDHRNLF